MSPWGVFLSASFLLALFDSANLFPKKCTCHGGDCDCSWMSLHNIPAGVVGPNINFSHDIKHLDTTSTFQGSHISSIILDNNMISKIQQSAFKNLKTLQNLSLSHNIVQEIHPLSFQNIPELVDINLRGNRLASLHSGLFRNNRKLRKIDISNNRLKYVPSEVFKHNQFILEVRLNENHLAFLPSELFRTNHLLKTVHFGDNNITSIDQKTFLYNKNLRYVNFSNNKITSLDAETFKYNCNLKFVDFSRNNLMNFELCQSQCFSTDTKIEVSSNPVSCDSALQVNCGLFKIHVSNDCNIEKSTKIFERWKREAYSKPITNISTPETTTNSITSSESNYTYLENTETNTSWNLLYDSSVRDSEDTSEAYNESSTFSTAVSGEMDFNMTTIVTLIKYDSPLVLRESTMRGFIFIGIEISLAGVIVLRKALCTKSKKHSAVDTVELLSKSTSHETERTEIDTHSV